MEYNENNDNTDNTPAPPKVVITPSSPAPERNNMAIASMIVGIFALLTSCCSFVGFILSVTGIVLVILSKKGKPLSGFAVAGLVLSILGLVFTLLMFAYWLLVLNIMKDPEWGPMLNEMMNTMEKYQTVP